jgi:hypothetical protein
MLVVDFVALFRASACDPAILPLLEDVLARRDDLDRPTVRDLVAACRRRAKDEISMATADTKAAPSIFTRLLRPKK